MTPEFRNELQTSSEVVYHPVNGVLCYCPPRYPVRLPVRFRDEQAAKAWVATGTIADIQEALGILDVDFYLDYFIPSRSAHASS